MTFFLILLILLNARVLAELAVRLEAPPVIGEYEMLDLGRQFG